jgi:uncharacterized protein YlxW (UPF0749 family)
MLATPARASACDTAAVDWLADHGPAVAAIAFGVLVLAGLIVLGVRALMLWRAIKAAKRAVETHLAALTAEADKLSAELARLPERQAELQRAISALQSRISYARVLAEHAGEAMATLRSPLRYLGG